MSAKRAAAKAVHRLRAWDGTGGIFSPMRSFSGVSSVDNKKLVQMKIRAMQHELDNSQREAAAKAVPWFVENMPDSYFENVPEEMQKAHLRAIAGISQEGATPEMTLTSDKSITVLLASDRKSDTLAELLETFRRSGFKRTSEFMQQRLTAVQVFASHDGSLRLPIFTFGGTDGVASAADTPAPVTFEGAQALFDKIKGTEDTWVEIRMDPNVDDRGTIYIVAANIVQTSALMRASRYLSAHGISVEDANVSDWTDHTGTLGIGDEPAYVVMMKLQVKFKGRDGVRTPPPNARMITELQRVIKWQNDRDFQFAVHRPELESMAHAEVINALATLQHVRLGLTDPYSFTQTNILQMIEQPQLMTHVVKIGKLFMQRFDPDAPMKDAEFQAQAAALEQAFENTAKEEDELRLLNGMLDAVKSTLRTNLYFPNRYALALRLSPHHMGHGTVGTDLPFGVFFVYGRRFKGFHVRFRDIARGGLRVVAPRSKDQHAAESTRTYNEAYSLAYAQQLKNKDIPEGGSKATILLEPDENDKYHPQLYGQGFMVRKCVRAFTECILDLTSKDKNIVDYLNKDELIYLGPDENIIPSDIEYIINRAVQRGYVTPQALMSSKAKNGLNHKEFGVTSEGVAVNLQVALRKTGKHPDDTGKPFTVKLTGGTDGDVAGNMLRLLHEQFGSNVKVVGLADGTACLEDPNGLDMSELLTMVEKSEPLSSFSKDKLGLSGILTQADTFNGSQLRDTMHNRVQADAFVPAGGRPGTINVRNYRDYYSGPNQTPSSSLIVEGANLFITPEARQALFDEKGVIIVKDSSANKCGVITSSYEILASMLVSPEEFVDIKDELVPDVLIQLKRLARTEAELLFHEFSVDPHTALPKQSERISRAIIRVHDAITNTLSTGMKVKADGTMDWDQLLIASSGGACGMTLGEVVASAAGEHVPKKLLEQVNIETLRERVPWMYLVNIVACNLATRLVYTEGLEFTENLPVDDLKIANTAFRYVSQSQLLEKLVQQVQAASELEDAGHIIRILKKSGTNFLD